MSKKCFKCGGEKPLSEFYKHKQMADGHLNKCKECTKLDSRSNRANNIEYYRAYDSARGCRQSREYFSEWKISNPIKRSAHIVISNAIRSGKIKKKSNCESCGVEHGKMHAHHDDYSMPLLVRWLCPSCHKIWHNESGEGLNAN